MKFSTRWEKSQPSCHQSAHSPVAYQNQNPCCKYFCLLTKKTSPFTTRISAWGRFHFISMNTITELSNTDNPKHTLDLDFVYLHIHRYEKKRANVLEMQGSSCKKALWSVMTSAVFKFCTHTESSFCTSAAFPFKIYSAFNSSCFFTMVKVLLKVFLHINYSIKYIFQTILAISFSATVQLCFLPRIFFHSINMK